MKKLDSIFALTGALIGGSANALPSYEDVNCPDEVGFAISSIPELRDDTAQHVFLLLVCGAVQYNLTDGNNLNMSIRLAELYHGMSSMDVGKEHPVIKSFHNRILAYIDKAQDFSWNNDLHNATAVYKFIARVTGAKETSLFLALSEEQRGIATLMRYNLKLRYIFSPYLINPIVPPAKK